MSVPAHKQTDPAKKPGQRVFSPVAPNTPYGFDRHPYLKSPNCEPDKGDRTLSDYIKRINERN